MSRKRKLYKPEDSSASYKINVGGENLPPFLEEMARELSSRVIGQERAIRRALRHITIYEAGLNDPRRPVGALMLAGPSGVGKTYFAKEFAKAWIGPVGRGLEPWVFVDCGSLSLEHTVSSLTGSPPGYVGYGEQSNLEKVGEYERSKKGVNRDAERITRWNQKNNSKILQFLMNLRPDMVDEIRKRMMAKVDRMYEEAERRHGPLRSIVIFDEIEKASKTIQRQLLSILEEGQLAMLNGRVVDFRGSFLLFTTNVGTAEILSEYLDTKKLGFDLPVQEQVRRSNGFDEAIYHRVLREIEDSRKGYFLPEFLGRIGRPGIIVFHTLKPEHYSKILRLMLREQIVDVLSGLPKNGGAQGALLVSYTPKLEKFLIEKGVSPSYGARALRSVIEKYVKIELALRILNDVLLCGDNILLDVEFEEKTIDGRTMREPKIIVRRQRRQKGVALPPFKFGHASVKEFNPEKILDDFLNGLIKELSPKAALPQKPSRNGTGPGRGSGPTRPAAPDASDDGPPNEKNNQ